MSDEDLIIEQVVERYLKTRDLRRPIDYGIIWDLSFDAARDYYRCSVDRRYIENRIANQAGRVLELEKEKRPPEEAQASTLEDEIASLSDRQLKAAIANLYEEAERLVEIDMGSKRALRSLYESELSKRGYEVNVKTSVSVRFFKNVD